MMNIFRAIPLLAMAIVTIAAGDAPDSSVVALRGDVQLSGTALRDALTLLEPQARSQVTANPQALANFARERLLNMVVLSEAKSKKWDQQPDVMRRIDEARDAVIVQSYLASVVPADPAYPSESDVAQAYETNKARLNVPRQYHILQIVLMVKQGATPQENEDIHKKAYELRAQAMRPKADFSDIATKNSQEQQSAAKGGDVGWIREPDMLPAVREAVSGLTEGAISQPVRAPDGWHVLKVIGIRPQHEASLSDATPQLTVALRQARVQRLIRAYLDDLVKTQPIQVNEIELGKQVGDAK